MRTTITLEPDVAQLITRTMSERGLSFKEAVNEAIRAGASPKGALPPPAFESYDMGPPLVDITKALQVASGLEDQELISKLTQGR